MDAQVKLPEVPEGYVLVKRSDLEAMIKTVPSLSTGWSPMTVLNMSPFKMIPHIERMLGRR